MKIDISIIICTYNRCETLKSVLESIDSLNGNGSFGYEFIIVDNNSTDKTREIVEKFRDQRKSNIKYIFEPQQGIGHARNRGIREAGGNFLVFTDDGCLPEPAWLTEILKCFKMTGFGAMGGRILPRFPADTPKWVNDCK